MKDYYNDLIKIADLLRSDEEANAILGLNLCLGMEPYCIDTWQLVFERIGSWYWIWEESKSPEELMDLEVQVAQLIYQQLPAFEEEERSYWISEFVGQYLSFNKHSSSVIFDLEANLQKEINLHDWSILLLATGRVEQIGIALELIQPLPVKAFFDKEAMFFYLWNRNYKFWKKSVLKRSGGPYSWHGQWHEFSALILKFIERYYHEAASKITCPFDVFELLRELWQDAGLYDLDKRIDLSIQTKIIKIICHPFFPVQEQQDILLAHQCLTFTERYLVRIGGMSGDCEANIYDCLAEDVEDYLKNFNGYKNLLRVETWTDARKASFKKVIYEIWKYYYLPCLEPFFQLIGTWDDTDADGCFYLGQLYFGFKEDQEKALLYFEKFLALAPDRIPENNFFITEMNYAGRCYAPSVLEALTWIGTIHEDKGENDKAIECYKKAIRMAPNHHQAPYLSLFKIGEKLNHPKSKLLDLLEQYKVVFYEQTTWLDPKAHSYNIAIELGPNRKAWTDRYDYLMVPDPGLGRFVGYPDLKLAMVYQFYAQAEWLYYEEEKAQEALAFCLKAKRLLEHDLEMGTAVYKKEKKYPLPTKPIKIEDVLYLQAELMVDLYKDYWQAQSIYKKILKQNPNHHLAKKALKNVQNKIGY